MFFCHTTAALTTIIVGIIAIRTIFYSDMISVIVSVLVVIIIVIIDSLIV